jgi:methylthioribulose-1-phosphate dehydratase
MLVAVMSAHRETAAALVEIAAGLHRRGWMLGTSGNLSGVTSRDPLRLAITRSGVDKGALAPGDVLEIDGDGAVLTGEGRSSDETALHLALVRRGAGAVLHTHSVWATLLSDVHLGAGGLVLEGYEMLKGLSGVKSHQHREWLPVLDNSQDYVQLAAEVEDTLDRHPGSHALLLRGHGLYAWGADLREARRHVEVLEFLLEVRGRLFRPGG